MHIALCASHSPACPCQPSCTQPAGTARLPRPAVAAAAVASAAAAAGHKGLIRGARLNRGFASRGLCVTPIMGRWAIDEGRLFKGLRLTRPVRLIESKDPLTTARGAVNMKERLSTAREAFEGLSLMIVIGQSTPLLTAPATVYIRIRMLEVNPPRS